MKKLALLALATTLTTSAFAAEEFGGLKFHSTVEKAQVDSLKSDLRYLYKNPISSPDKEFLSVAQFAVGDGPYMHNWLVNRIQYIFGENYKFDKKDMVLLPGKFPATPLPDLPEPEEKSGPKVFNEGEEPRAVTVMSNMGGAFYLMGKMNKIFIGFNFDAEKVYVKSPRAGLLQVGEGLFMPGFLFNKDVNHPSNSIFRMSTLFHEARHSDGNGKHTGFLHAKCPQGHPMAGNYACESVANGPYTIGGLSERHLVKNCSICSTAEKTALSAEVADSFGRIIELPAVVKGNDNAQLISIYSSLISTYESMVPTLTSDAEKMKYSQEILRLKAEVTRLSNQKALFAITTKPEKVDPTPEGTFTTIGLKDSIKAMEKSLSK